MNIQLLLFSLIVYTAHTHAMKRANSTSTKAYNKKLTISEPSPDFPQYTSLPSDIQNVIIDFSTHYTTAQKPKDAVYTIKALAVTNKKLNLLINKPQFSDNLIKNLADKFSCSHETIAKFLGTPQAKQRLALQRQFKNLCGNPKLNASELNASLPNIDLDFTYNQKGSQRNLLMLSISFNNKPMFKYLKKNHANINNYNSIGFTPLHFAAQWRIHKKFIKLLLQEPTINVNQQNISGLSPLLHSIVNRNRIVKRELGYISIAFINTIAKLLNAGADPELANKKGLTPLGAAHQLGDIRIINLIQAAIQAKRQ